MSCCPKAPEISVGGWAGDDEGIGPSVEMAAGESVDCYMRRVANMTDRLDDKTEPVPDKIENNDIPMVQGTDVNVKFRLTVNSTRTAASWSAKSDPALPPAVTFSGDTLKGSFPKDTYGKRYTLTVSAGDAAGEIDSRSFVFSPAKATGYNEITFVHPLPGSTVTSAYGNRRPPKSGASSKHQGVDFAKGGSAPVLAAADGVVVFARAKGNAGNVVIVQHMNASGKELCRTLYMHLARIDAAEGKIVVAGQKIGVEGTTGNSTGVHLHFECRLPNNEAVEPTQFIKGVHKASRMQTEDGKLVGVEDVVTGGSLTPENMEAKSSGCPPVRPRDADGNTVGDDAPDGDDWFEKAWFFTMREEVGDHWSLASEKDPEVIAGKVDTAAQRHKVGLQNFPKNGGWTKFGIAQNPNPDLKPVSGITYETAKNRGFNGYWKGRAARADKEGKHKLAVMLFDMTFLHGAGNVNTIWKNANIDSMPEDQAIERLSAQQLQFMYKINGNKEFGGWPKRNARLLQYVKGLT